MKFKVGDIVKFKSGDHVPRRAVITNAEYCVPFGYSLSGTYEVEGIDSEMIKCKGIGWHFADRFELATKREPEVCNWEADSEGNYSTSCGETFTLIDGTPEDNRMKYCPYCGKPIRQVE